MNLNIILPVLFSINALIHFIQWPLYGLNKKTIPVIIFGVIYLILGILWINSVSPLIQWISFILTSIGFIGLGTQIEKSTNAKWIDYSIFGLDLVTISLLTNLLILPRVLSLIGH